MAVTYTTDELLLLEVIEQPYLILAYHSNECGEPCNNLITAYYKLSKENQYQDVVFLRIDADISNPVAKKFILKSKALIISIYHNRKLVESKTIVNEEEIIGMLSTLIKH